MPELVHVVHTALNFGVWGQGDHYYKRYRATYSILTSGCELWSQSSSLPSGFEVGM